MSNFLLSPKDCRLMLDGQARSFHTYQGFTLVETMVVVAILAILGSLAAPAMREIVLKNQLGVAQSALQVSLNLARSEAVKRGADARVTIAANGLAGAWISGWTIFVDGTANANGGVAPSASSAVSCSVNCVTLLEVVAPLNGGLGYGQTGSLNYFSYNGEGRLIDVTGGGVINRSAWFFKDQSEKYCLIINNIGRVRTARVSNALTCASAGS
jgi:type IV fimbrial biogenesis protein FimT